MIRWLAIRVAFVAFLVIPWGCSTMQELIDSPRLTYQGMSQAPVSLFEAKPSFRFLVENANPRGLTIDRVAYDLKINGRPFLKGVSTQNKRVQAASATEMEIAIDFNYLDLFPGLTELETTPSVHFDLSCEVQIPPFSIPFHADGAFTLPRPPVVTLKGARPGTSQEGPATVIRAKNPNGFAITIDGLDYALRAGGRDAGLGVIRQSISLPAQSDVFVELPLTPLEGASLTAPPWEVEGHLMFRVPGRGHRSLPFQASSPDPTN